MHPTVILALLYLSCVGAVNVDESSETGRGLFDIFDLIRSRSSQSRNFFDYFDRGNAFNTSVAFTIPLFSFTLPGAQDSIDSGLDDGNTFGVLAFVALFLLAALGVAIFTTSQGGNAAGVARSFYSPYLNSDEGHSLTAKILNAIYEVPNVIDVPSCYHLSVCQAYARPKEYGLLGKGVRWFTGIRNKLSYGKKTSVEKAMEYGLAGKEDCYYEYPCLVEPLDTLIFLGNKVTNKFTTTRGSK